MAALIGTAIACSGGPIKIYSWVTLDKVRNDLGGSYILMNDLNATTVGYLQLARATANGGEGWDPIGTSDEPFTGTFDGQGYAIEDLVINRPDRDKIGLFGAANNAIIDNLGVVNATVMGHSYVGGLVGMMEKGSMDNCYFAGNVTGESPPGVYEYRSLNVGGLLGEITEGTVSNCHFSGNVTGFTSVGGLVGWKGGDPPWVGNVSNSYSSSNVYGAEEVGGLIGYNRGDVSDSYFTGNVTVLCCAGGGLVGNNQWGGHIINSHYSYDEVLINGENVITIGALFDGDFEEWLANDKFLDVNERLSQDEGVYYMVADVSDLKEVVTFGQDSSLIFVLQNDLDLAGEPDFYIPYLAGVFGGGGHNISNLSVHLDFANGVGLFGYVAEGSGGVYYLGAENVSISANSAVGGLVGHNDGDYVYDCYSTGSVLAHDYYSEAGGLVGLNLWDDVEACYSTCSVDGWTRVGGLIGRNQGGDVSSCYSTGIVNSEEYEYSGGLVGWIEGGSVEDCYATGLVYSGLVGGNDGTVSNSFWDIETSETATSDGGTGKNTTEMQNILTFTDTETEGLDGPWDMTEVVDSDSRNTDYIWNIVDGETYPFLSWQSV
jgi:hypothetical protein